MIKELSPLEACRIIKEHDFPLMITTLPPIPATMDGKTEKDLWNVIETTLKALEIIKKYIKVYKIHNGYMLTDENSGETMISKDEYDLLKEVLS